MLAPSIVGAAIIALIVEVASSSETSAHFYRITRRSSPEDRQLRQIIFISGINVMILEVTIFSWLLIF
jgi:hypothetical protein